jgi:hypothetical protein
LGCDGAQVAVDLVHDALLGVTEQGSAFDDRVEYGPEAGRGAADDGEDLGHGGLLVEGFGDLAVAVLELVEEAGVFDGDDGLVGEGLEKSNLTIGEGVDPESRACDVPDDRSVPTSRTSGTAARLMGPR